VSTSLWSVTFGNHDIFSMLRHLARSTPAYSLPSFSNHGKKQDPFFILDHLLPSCHSHSTSCVLYVQAVEWRVVANVRRNEGQERVGAESQSHSHHEASPWTTTPEASNGWWGSASIPRFSQVLGNWIIWDLSAPPHVFSVPGEVYVAGGVRQLHNPQSWYG